MPKNNPPLLSHMEMKENKPSYTQMQCVSVLFIIFLLL